MKNAASWDLPSGTQVSHINNENGKAVTIMRFESFPALEAFFAHRLIGHPGMENSASKVIGKTLLIWNR